MPAFLAISTNPAATSRAWARDSIWQGPAMSTSGRWLPSLTPPTSTTRDSKELDKAGLPNSGGDKAAKQRMRREGLGFQFRMELHPDEPRVIGILDDFRQ